ncbi:MAG TPA: UbiA family prenyltransferase [Steroidobacteraceae bacterium]
MAVSAPALRSPLCVDLDGSVIRTDLLDESLLLLIKQNVLYLFMALWWLSHGRARLQAEIAARVRINPAALPYNEPVVEWLRGERDGGREIWLCTAADEDLAYSVADYLGVFGAVVVDPDPALHPVASQVPELPSFRFAGSSRLGAALRALRPHQWAKNVLIFIPLLAAHRAGDARAVLDAGLAFVAFSLCASSVYLLNDMLDLQADRQHVRKSKRPFASGELQLRTGFVLAPVLLIAAAMVAAFLPSEFQLVLVGYYVLTLAYSLALKGIVMVDTTTLAGLYTVRIVAGAATDAIALSFWLLLFSGFFFLSLAFVKRYAELDAVRRQHRRDASGRGYRVEDLSLLEGLGIAAGYISVLVLALYINSPAITAMYRHPHLIWPLCALVLYWMSRIWMKTHRGRMHDDPVIFALRDRVSLGVGMLAALTIYLAI